MNKIRYNPRWWSDTKIEGFDWNGAEGPAKQSYDVFGDGSLRMINIPGHSPGLCALKIVNAEGQFVLLFSDGGYAKKSLLWIREQCLAPNCVESLANHDPDAIPHVIEL